MLSSNGNANEVSGHYFQLILGILLLNQPDQPQLTENLSLFHIFEYNPASILFHSYILFMPFYIYTVQLDREHSWSITIQSPMFLTWNNIASFQHSIWGLCNHHRNKKLWDRCLVVLHKSLYPLSIYKSQCYVVVSVLD